MAIVFGIMAYFYTYKADRKIKSDLDHEEIPNNQGGVETTSLHRSTDASNSEKLPLLEDSDSNGNQSSGDL